MRIILLSLALTCLGCDIDHSAEAVKDDGGPKTFFGKTIKNTKDLQTQAKEEAEHLDKVAGDLADAE